MSTPADLSKDDKPISIALLSHDKPSQSLQPKPATIQKWLNEEPYEEPWSTFSSRVENCSISDAHELLKELDRGMAQDMKM
jgi:hypothetical protein